ncbi:MAG: hypothetical protein M9965_02680 [Anaerolineae bacterium]|nr:hypothetical protein [Anaerolineae bacterium]
MNPIRQFAITMIMERPARKLDLAGHASQLQQSGEVLSKRLGSMMDSDRNRQVLSHIIGIERWSQSRLRVPLGSEFVNDEYDRYRPKRDTSWSDLKTQFHTTRAASVDLVGALQAADVDPATIIKHNNYGPLTIRGWLHYINMHANLESKRLK